MLDTSRHVGLIVDASISSNNALPNFRKSLISLWRKGRSKVGHTIHIVGRKNEEIKPTRAGVNSEGCGLWD